MTNFYQVGGSLKPDSPSYLKRQADKTLYEGLKGGEYCYVLNSPQMGKSSLWAHTQKQLTKEGIKCATLDLRKIGESTSEHSWYRVLFYELVNSFDLSIKNEPKAWWDKRKELSPINRLTEFLDNVLLREIEENIVICLDEIDTIISLNFSTNNFWAWIRSLYNQRSTKPIYNHLTFCILGVATISDLIRDKAGTVFNIGQNISLSGFNESEVVPLANGLKGKVPNPQRVLEQILEWTGGQPFLTQKICDLILKSRTGLTRANPETKIDIKDFIQSQIINNWESQDNPEHLGIIRNRLLNSSSVGRRMLKLYQKILVQGEIKDDSSPESVQLRLTGLVIQHHQTLKVSNKIYRNVFDEAWLKKELDKIPPYLEKYEAWLNSGEDSSRLLSGQDLEKALDWSEKKFLTEEEVRFLELSQTKQNQRLISEILLWTGNQFYLIEIICHMIVEYKNEIREGQEKEFIKQLIQKHIIENWQEKDAAEHLMEIQNNLLATDGDVQSRLEIYKDVLQGIVIADDKPEKLALLEAELVTNNEGWLEVTNRIYKEVFNLEWVNEELEKMVVLQNQPAPLTSNTSLWALTSFMVITILWFVLKPEKGPNPVTITSSIPEICTQRDLSISLEKNIQKLASLKNQQGNNFPLECDTQLTELKLIKQAIALAVNNRVANFPNQEDALEILCQIPKSSRNFNDAKFWAKKWHQDNYWKLQIEEDLQQNPQCNQLIQ